MKKALVFDIGGTKIYSTTVDKNGKILSEIEKFSTPKNADEIKDLLKNVISKYENSVDAIAIATAGAVNNENTGLLGSTGNMPAGYEKTDFQLLSAKKVYVENDANAAAWAEHKIGASKGTKYSVMLTFGTGVGGGIILDNKLYKGKSGAAGEMHFKLRNDKKRKCTCGAWDCYEIYASGTGLKLTAEEITGNKDITTYDVINGLKNSDSKMAEVFNRWQEDILDGLIGLGNIFDPEVIVLSGSMGEFLDEKYLEDEVNKEIVTTPLKVKKASAGNYSGMIGAGLLALESLNNG